MQNVYGDIFNGAASQYGLDPNWLTALGQWESGFNPNAQSSAGAVGIMQLMPATGASVGVSQSQLTDPTSNIYGGANYLSQLLQRAGGDYPTATMWYNCGPGNTCPAGQKEAAGVQGIYNGMIQGSGNPSNAATSQTPNSSKCASYDIFCYLDNLTGPVGTLGTQNGSSGGLSGWVSRIPIIILGLIMFAGAIYLYKTS